MSTGPCILEMPTVCYKTEPNVTTISSIHTSIPSTQNKQFFFLEKKEDFFIYFTRRKLRGMRLLNLWCGWNMKFFSF